MEQSLKTKLSVSENRLNISKSEFLNMKKRMDDLEEENKKL